MSKTKKILLRVKGMHCPSCEILVREQFKEVDNVRKVVPNYSTQQVEVEYTGHLSTQTLNSKIKQFGYTIMNSSEDTNEGGSFISRLFDFSLILFALIFSYLLLRQLGFNPSFQAEGKLSFTAAFILGIIASLSTCMATTGALFLSTIGNAQGGKRSLMSALSFVAGRIASYAFFGLLFGFVGKAFVTSLGLESVFTVVLSIIMILLGLDMARIISLRALFPNVGASLFEKLETPLKNNPKKMGFLLGIITYFLPCGFTQTVQVYALGLADPVKSSLTMLFFALGTVPVLLSLSFVSTFTTAKWYGYVQKTIGVIVFLVGISYVGNAFALQGIFIGGTSSSSTNQEAVRIENGVQIVRMNVNANGYTPETFTVKKGIPVKWIINGENIYGCQGSLLSPKIQVRAILNPGENIIEFTPTEAGVVPFSCSMGMYRGQFTVIS